MPNLTVSRLIEILNKVSNEVGGDAEVKLFNGSDYESPMDAEDDGFSENVADVISFAAKSFMMPNSIQNLNGSGVRVWIKYER